ncbi:hypothetical protein ACHWQZ_G008149 [Mnemiopsis leidyi]
MACGAIDPRMMDLVWTDRLEYEALLHKRPSCTQAQPTTGPSSTKAAADKPVESSVRSDGKSLLAELEAARGFIRANLERKTPETTLETLQERATRLETSNVTLRNLVANLTKQIENLEAKASITVACPVPSVPVNASKPAGKPAAKPAKKEESDDDDFDFGESDEDDAPKGESEMQKMKRLAAEKKAADAAAKKDKPAPVLKSNVVLDIKPWDDETDLQEMEKAVRAIKMDGLTWGDSKLVEIGFGIKKLRISTCIIDELVGLYDLEDNITELEDYVQSVDIVSHNKI